MNSLAIKLLARRSHFEKELREKLTRKGLEASEIDESIAYCLKKGYLNDIETAKQYIREQERKGQGPRLIALKLKAKANLPDGTIQELVQSVDQEAAIQRLLERQYRGKEREKILVALERRGFDFHIILEQVESQK